MDINRDGFVGWEEISSYYAEVNHANSRNKHKSARSMLSELTIDQFKALEEKFLKESEGNDDSDENLERNDDEEDDGLHDKERGEHNQSVHSNSSSSHSHYPHHYRLISLLPVSMQVKIKQQMRLQQEKERKQKEQQELQRVTLAQAQKQQQQQQQQQKQQQQQQQPTTFEQPVLSYEDEQQPPHKVQSEAETKLSPSSYSHTEDSDPHLHPLGSRRHHAKDLSPSVDDLLSVQPSSPPMLSPTSNSNVSSASSSSSASNTLLPTEDSQTRNAHSPSPRSVLDSVVSEAPHQVGLVRLSCYDSSCV
jgi:hypothetical protein